MDILMVYWKATWQAAMGTRSAATQTHDGDELAAFARRLRRPTHLASALCPAPARPGVTRFALR